MKMKERFHAVCRFLNMISQGNHRVLFWLSRKRFCRCHTSVSLLVFLSADSESAACRSRTAPVCIPSSSFCSCSMDLGLFEKVCRQYLDGQKEFCLALIGTENHRKGAGAGI